MRYVLWLMGIVVLVFGVSACSTNSARLPLAQGKPTLLFFYTEN